MMKPLYSNAIHPPFGHYAHGVACNGQTMVMTSGILGISKDGAIPISCKSQARICFQAIAQILKEATMSPNDIVQLRAYVTDRAYFSDYMSERDTFLNKRNVASTLIVVSGFTRPEFKIEIEATAIKQNWPNGQL